MTTFKVPAREDVSPASQAAFDALKKALGMVPNLYAAIAYSDNAFLNTWPTRAVRLRCPIRRRRSSTWW